MKKILYTICFVGLILVGQKVYAQADSAAYLDTIKAELKEKWPANRTINLVFHGHSVPSGYFQTPLVRRMDAYPFLVMRALDEKYPTAVINVITTSIGGENSEQGEKRFKTEVTVHRPDVLFIDYALNDRNIGLERSRTAMEKMIVEALAQDIKVVLLTPSPDLTVDLLLPDNTLELYRNQLVDLSKKYNIAIVDSYQVFKKRKAEGEELKLYMAQSNHPNEKGHKLIADEIMHWF
ncbi:SGNH/GDSL hydrolase family protein [Sphingobacterium chuzhouense]|uniref:SGNH/GDSL hydrolase family protein n=1 Tax=Sphingobacterium chuzhouense TaxID=1742264 RepID=A0ABR7XUW7_9SPHI|nr:GDSL-type esterase/lipase family protein [Sphingobacterium chuzhouense]MBD1422841.1 SGNH/GDSL hydrolase family protein [Sphingobacterium chuzhouense]